MYIKHAATHLMFAEEININILLHPETKPI